MRLLRCGHKPANGYRHWGCQKRRWHDKRWPWQSRHVLWPSRWHRFNNYVWVGDQRAHYQPVPIDVRWKA